MGPNAFYLTVNKFLANCNPLLILYVITSLLNRNRDKVLMKYERNIKSSLSLPLSYSTVMGIKFL